MPALAKSGGFTRSVVALASGTAGAQVLTMAIAPLLTRLYTPTDFGISGVFASLMVIFGAIGAMRYEAAIPIHPRDSDVGALLRLCGTSALLVTTVVGVGILAMSPAIVRWTNAVGLERFLWLLPGALLLSAGNLIMVTWATRMERYDAVVHSRAALSIAGAVAQIGIVWLAAGPLGLIVGQCLGLFVGFGVLFVRYRCSDGARESSPVAAAQLWELAKKYRKFPLWSGPAALINVVCLQLPVLFLSRIFNPATAAQFFLLNRVLSAPVSLVSNATVQIFIGSAAAQLRGGTSLRSFFHQVFRQQLLLGLPLLAMVPFAPMVFGAVFGEEWRQAGWFAVCYLPALYLQFVATSVGAVLDVVQRQDLHLMREACRAVLLALAMGLVCLKDFTPLHTVGLLSIASGLAYALHICLSWIAVRDADRSGIAGAAGGKEAAAQ